MKLTQRYRVEVQGIRMKTDHLREQLKHLRAELQQADALDPKQRELLVTRADDIEQLLKQDEISKNTGIADLGSGN